MSFRKTIPRSPEQEARALEVAENNRRVTNNDMKMLLDAQAKKIASPKLQWATLGASIVAIIMPIIVECCK